MTFFTIYSLIIIYIIIKTFKICLKKDLFTIKNFKENIFLVAMIFYSNIKLITLFIFFINILISIFTNNVAYCMDFYNGNTSLVSINPGRVNLDFPEITENQKSPFQYALEKKDFYGKKEFNVINYLSEKQRLFSIDRNFLISNIPETITEIGVDGSFKSKSFISDYDKKKLIEFNNLENISQKQALSLKYLFEKQNTFILKKFSTILEIKKILSGSCFEKTKQLEYMANFDYAIFNIYLEMFSIVKVHEKLNTIEKIELLNFLINQIRLNTEMYKKLKVGMGLYTSLLIKYTYTHPDSLKISSYLKTILKVYIEKYIKDRNLLIGEIENELEVLNSLLVEEFSSEIKDLNSSFFE